MGTRRRQSLVKAYGIEACGRQRPAPRVGEAAVLAYERDAFVRHVLDGDGESAARVAAWSGDVLDGEVR
ncbi:hypothetical protein [Streptomyces sp. NPDC046909]|uniref:hypothetical protein n=1 Tax=Streptomyces sp. NPDC046909 TaxID=3155617 RepID=UPI0034052E73